MLPKPPLSVVIITLNAEETIKLVLEALQAIDEVVVYDTGSTDGTLDLARSFANTIAFEGQFIGFGPTKNAAIQCARNDWILSLDADEIPSVNLLANISCLDYENHNLIGEVDRHNYILGRRVKCSGWGGDKLVRLFHRGFTLFDEKLVHEAVHVPIDASVIHLSGELKHYAVNRLDQMIDKVKRYSELKQSPSKQAIPYPFVLVLVIIRFIQTFIFRLGFLDGWRGFLIAFSNASGVFWKYMRRHENKN